MTVWHTTKTRYNDLNMNYTMSNVSADIILSLVIIRNSFTLAIPRAEDSRVSFQCTRPYLGQHFLFNFPCTFPSISSNIYKGSNLSSQAENHWKLPGCFAAFPHGCCKKWAFGTSGFLQAAVQGEFQKNLPRKVRKSLPSDDFWRIPTNTISKL